MPQYLHLPLQILWFDIEIWSVVVVLYAICMVYGGWLWLILPIGVYAFIVVKRGKPRGFLRHLLYKAGIYKLDFYPPAHSRDHHE